MLRNGEYKNQKWALLDIENGITPTGVYNQLLSSDRCPMPIEIKGLKFDKAHNAKEHQFNLDFGLLASRHECCFVIFLPHYVGAALASAFYNWYTELKTNLYIVEE